MAPLTNGNTMSLPQDQFGAAYEAITRHPENGDLAELGVEFSRGPVSSDSALGEPVSAVDFVKDPEIYNSAKREIALQQELARLRNTGDRIESLRNRGVAG